MKTFIIKNISIVNEGRTIIGDVVIEGELIKDILEANSAPNVPNATIIDGTGKHLLPGVIDDQVHFREPGLTHKADIFTESLAAVAGGTTSFMEMPNTNPQTTTQQLLNEKYSMGSQKSLANYSFYIGATNDNLNELLKTDPRTVCGIKIFMGSSTGNMLVDNPKTLEGIFKESPMLIATHCEDEATIKANTALYKQKFGDDIPITYHPIIRDAEACYKSSALAVEMAAKYGTRLHVLHLSSAKETALFEKGNHPDKKITAEVCVHHLWFSDEDYDKKGTFIKWNPAVKSPSDRAGLWTALLDGRLDVIATDHAPHTLDEKKNNYSKAPSGGPLVQHSLVAMLEFAQQGKISIETVVEKMSHQPARLFKVSKRGFIRKGYYADLVIVNTNAPWQVTPDNILYKCKWSPFEGFTFNSKIEYTFINGHPAYAQGNIDQQFRGMRLSFDR